VNNSPLEIRKITIGVVLAIIWMCLFIFIKDSIVIDWNGDGSNLTSFKLVIGVIGLLVIVFYNLLMNATAETKKLTATATLTIIWLSLILFYPFKDPNNTNSGAVAFFAMLGGLAVVVLWVRFFSDELVAPA
jgi:tryptophan-rich sensory protein